jgi:hypothetical protein
MPSHRFFLFLVITLMFCAISCSGGESGPEDPDGYVEFTIRGASSMQKIIAVTDLNSLQETFTVQGAKGEHEAFQIVPVLPQRNQQIHDCVVQASDLTMGDQSISSGNIQVFLEYFVNVTEPSDEGGKVGKWPDALIPLSVPFDVKGDFPSPVWINIDIPRNAIPGTYDGSIVMSASNGPIVTYKYTLEVWNIEMPRKLYIKSNFGLDQENIAEEYGLGDDLLSSRGREITRMYAKYLAERYTSTHGVPVFRPTMELNPDRRSYTIDFTEMETDIKIFCDYYDLSCIHFPLSRFDLYPEGFIGLQQFMFTDDFNARLIDYTNQVSHYFQDRGYLDRNFALTFDEPQNAEHYQYIRNVSDVMRQAELHPDLMVTEQPHPQTDECGPLYDWVDIFTPNIRMFQYFGSEANARLGAENHEEWIYTNISVYPFPSYAIDKQGVETRLFYWFVYEHGFTGAFYGSALDWSQQNPWENPMTFGSLLGNGCNNFMYPGSMVNKYTGQNNTEQPIGSLRLEQIRDGLEDAQLLYMLGQGQPVEKTKEIMTDWYHYTSDPNELLRVREEIAQMIVAQ